MRRNRGQIDVLGKVLLHIARHVGHIAVFGLIRRVGLPRKEYRQIVAENIAELLRRHQRMRRENLDQAAFLRGRAALRRPEQLLIERLGQLDVLPYAHVCSPVRLQQLVHKGARLGGITAGEQRRIDGHGVGRQANAAFRSAILRIFRVQKGVFAGDRPPANALPRRIKRLGDVFDAVHAAAAGKDRHAAVLLAVQRRAQLLRVPT